MKTRICKDRGHRVRLYPAMGSMTVPGVSAGPAICEDCEAEGSWSRPWSGGRFAVMMQHKASDTPVTL